MTSLEDIRRQIGFNNVLIKLGLQLPPRLENVRPRPRGRLRRRKVARK